MPDTYLKIVLKSLAEKIDRLNGELYCRDYEIEKLKSENEKLNKKLEQYSRPCTYGKEDKKNA